MTINMVPNLNLPHHLRYIAFSRLADDERGKCDIPRCRESAKWMATTKYVEPDHGHDTYLCEKHARNFAFNLADLL